MIGSSATCPLNRPRITRGRAATGRSSPAGCGRPRSSSMVGATSQMRPPGADPRAAVGVVHVEERDGVERVGGVRLARRRVLHQLAVAVVGRDEDRAALRARRVDDLADAGVDRLDRVDGRVEHARCARPCRGWRSSPATKSYLPARDGLVHRLGDAGRAHLAASGRRWRRPSATGASCGLRPRRAPRARR